MPPTHFVAAEYIRSVPTATTGLTASEQDKEGRCQAASADPSEADERSPHEPGGDQPYVHRCLRMSHRKGRAQRRTYEGFLPFFFARATRNWRLGSKRAQR